MNDLIFQTLAGDEALSGMLGKICTADKAQTEIPAVFYGFSNTWDVAPSISYFLTECSDAGFADDVCVTSKLVYQLDIFADNARIDAVAERTDKLLRQIGFFRRNITEVPETNGRHKSLVYYTYTEERI